MSAGLPQDGVRIADFTWIIAGPYGAYLLARMGAEVIKIESLSPPDHIRGNPPHADRVAGVNRSGFFNSINAHKKSITLRLRDAEHAAIAKQLIGKCDAVIESFSPGTMDEFGLGYESLKQVRPDIVMVSCSGFGQRGRDSKLRAYMGTVHAYTGLNAINGLAGGPPRPLGGTWADYVTGTALAFAVVAALRQRKRTGFGQWIDLTMAEVVLSLMGQAFLDYFMNGRVAGTVGNESTFAAPNGAYPCEGDDAWIAVSIENDRQWEGLCRAIADRQLSSAQYRDVVSRRREASDIDERIAAWTRRRTPEQAMTELQAAGVPCAPSYGTEGLLRHEQLRARGFFVEPKHTEVGRRAIPNMPWRLSNCPEPPCSGAPLIGEHNEEVLGGLLGLPRDFVDKLNAERDAEARHAAP